MQIAVTFRHMETSDSIKAYIEEKLARIKKYLDEPIEAQAVVSVSKKIRHSAEVTLQAKGIVIKGSEETNDMYAAVDAVVDKIERQVKRYKEKIKRHKPVSGRERQVQKTILSAESFEEGQEKPIVIRQANFPIKPMSVEEAAMQMDLLDKMFLVFTDDQSEEINVIYRRNDGNFGLIVPQAS